MTMSNNINKSIANSLFCFWGLLLTSLSIAQKSVERVFIEPNLCLEFDNSKFNVKDVSNYNLSSSEICTLGPMNRSSTSFKITIKANKPESFLSKNQLLISNQINSINVKLKDLDSNLLLVEKDSAIKTINNFLCFGYTIEARKTLKKTTLIQCQRINSIEATEVLFNSNSGGSLKSNYAILTEFLANLFSFSEDSLVKEDSVIRQQAKILLKSCTDTLNIFKNRIITFCGVVEANYKIHSLKVPLEFGSEQFFPTEQNKIYFVLDRRAQNNLKNVELVLCSNINRKIKIVVPLRGQ